MCENTALMTKAIQKQKAGCPYAHDIVVKYSRDSNDAKCIKSIYTDCNPRNILSS